MPPTSDNPFAVTVDLALLTLRDGELSTLLVKRASEPHRGRLALPGGFVTEGESLEQAARRELQEEAGVSLQSVYREQLGAYGDPRRDPRGRVVSIAYLVVDADLPEPKAGSDAGAAGWYAVDEVLARPRRLAFDHARILRDALERVRDRLQDTSLAVEFLPEEFTVADLRRVYETVWDAELDPRNFHRKLTSSEGFLLPTGEEVQGDRGRPAALYRAGQNGRRLHPALLRPRR
jgi:8-oxo-dGTP diphosphatase